MAKRPVVRGNPQVDETMQAHAGDLAAIAKVFTRDLRASQKNLDADTVSKIMEQLYRVEAEVSAGKSILEKLRRIRSQQSTALVGGNRRKR